ncbi:uncharacterized protein LOC135498391 [Lineus longissimus]|uniref:uncharacterized protein LOC135498391 n=1 Tax=Lineus longissimus TaxID=88925 RepID=UPI00315D01AE
MDLHTYAYLRALCQRHQAMFEQIMKTELKTYHIRNAKVLALNIVAVEPIIDPTKFSSWTRLVMVTARILSLKNLPKHQWLKQLMTRSAAWPSMRRIKEAELYWTRYAQQGLDFDQRSIMKLNPFLDGTAQVYRVGGRIDKAPISYDMRHPYLLPKSSHISLLITRERHRHACHRGQIKTVAEIRKTHWIIRDVKLAKVTIRDCKICIRNRGKVLQKQMADLPFYRVRPFTPAFHVMLVDYLGPVIVKVNCNTVSKGYGAVFTCATVRAVHLTCVQDLTTEAFQQALERFVSIRGAPAKMISDNATCFRGANKETRQLHLQLDEDKVREASLKFRIEWKFGPPDGPHRQGAVERMVQEVKRAMKTMVNSDKLTFVEWETMFAQISALINCRPLTAVSSSPVDDQPVTPNHFLIGRGELQSPQVPCKPFTGNHHKRRQLCNNMVDNY